MDYNLQTISSSQSQQSWHSIWALIFKKKIIFRKIIHAATVAPAPYAFVSDSHLSSHKVLQEELLGADLKPMTWENIYYRMAIAN